MNTVYEKGKKIGSGKTKDVFAVKGFPELAILSNKDDVTKFNDESQTKKITGKGAWSTAVTCRIFELLKEADIPVSYVQQLSDNEFVAMKTKNIFLECIVRRLKIGSFLKRYPWEKQDPPRRMHRLITEWFLKTTKGSLKIGQKTLISGLTDDQDDPFITNPFEKVWKLAHPWKPEFDPESDLNKSVKASDILYGKITIEELDELQRKIFLILEGLFQIFGYRLADIKFEFGLTKDRRLVVTDVIDPDSWRLLSHDWVSFSKQAFRDGEDLDEIARKYGKIADMIEFCRVPRQALVIWKGSHKDDFEWPENIPRDIQGVNVIELGMSGHKKSNACLAKLEEIMRDYPDGGVIITKVGRSNGLGPTLSTHTNWQVISVPADWKKKSHNVWSHLDMASDAPMVTCLYDDLAVLAALNILALKNPIVYMKRQYAIEELDTNY